MKVSFIGLGVMGYPMAGFLAKAGHHVTVFNRTEKKASKWCNEFKGNYADSPCEAAKESSIVFTCVGNDDDVREVILGDKGVIHGLRKGAVIVDHTTASAMLASEIHETALQRELDFMDAPLSGGQAGAESGQLTIMVGGDQVVFDQVLPVMNCYAKACTLIGEVGCGQKAKMVME